MLKLRIREYSPMGEKGRILPATNIEYGSQINGEATLTFSLSQTDSVKMDSPFVVRVEYSTGGAFKAVPNNDFFVVYKDSGDGADAAKMVNYTGRNYLLWLLSKTYVHWATNAKNNERQVYGAGASHLRYFLLESKARGWGSQFNIDFTGNVDSNGATWTSDSITTIDWRLLTPLSEVLEEIVDQELCEWKTEGLTFRAYNNLTMGTNRSEIVLGGPRTERVPVEVDTTDIFTNLTVVPEKSSYWLYLSNTGLEGNVSKFGRLEATMTQSGIASHAEATKLAQSTLKQGRTIVRQESFEWTPSDDEDLIPWDDFDLGDMVTTLVRGGTQIRRVVGFVVNENDGATTVRVVAGEKASTSGAKIRERLKSVTVGNYTGGSGGGFPAVPTPMLAPPAKPVGLIETSNEAFWNGPNPVTRVGLEWAEVTEDTNGAEIDILEYEVWSHLDGEPNSFVASTNDTSIVIENWPSGIERLVSVRALSTNRDWSEFSDPIVVTPATPAALTPKAPTGLTEVANVGAFTSAGPIATVVLSWTAVTETVNDDPVDIATYTVYAGTTPIGTTTGTTFSTTVPSDVTRNFRVSATSIHGVTSDPSSQLAITGAKPTLVAADPTDPSLTSSMGSVYAKWDGGTVGSISLPYGYTLGVYARVLGDTDWTLQGARLTGPATQSVRVGDIGDTVEVEFRLFDALNRLAGTSTIEAITVVGVDVPDISDSLEAWIIANGGSHVHVGEIEPATPNENDLWFETDSEGDIKNIKIYNGTAFVNYALIADSILVANSITGRTLNVQDIWADTAWLNEVSAGVISADQINPIGERLNIYANEAVQIIVGTQNDHESAISTAQETADAAIDEATQAATEAASARQRALSAEAAALLAQTLAEDVDNALQQHQAIYIIDEYGAVIASVDQSNRLLMRPNYIAMVQNGLEVTRWEGNRMIVREIVVQEARIGNHQFTQYNPSSGPKHTIVRPIN